MIKEIVVGNHGQELSYNNNQGSIEVIGMSKYETWIIKWTNRY